MGSKRYMLKNGLGTMILSRAKSAKRIVDLFCGTGSVSWFAAENTNLPVLASDLQLYSTIYTAAVLERTTPLDCTVLSDTWLNKVQNLYDNSLLINDISKVDTSSLENFASTVDKARKLCMRFPEVGPIWKSYGGHYFSPKQAFLLDLMIQNLPIKDPEKTVCHAAVIDAASLCAASPGHTAQPFQPTDSAKRFLQQSWNKDILLTAKNALSSICSRYAKSAGKTIRKDAFDIIKDLNKDDLVIVDPPYSEVQYSRFYHVLETIARKSCGSVSGAGRYPELPERPQSNFSKRTQSAQALDKLLDGIADAGSTLIVTFPKNECSNGLSGDKVIEIAKKRFKLQKEYVYGVFSTLGGNHGHRAPRQKSSELILLMTPKH